MSTVTHCPYLFQYRYVRQDRIFVKMMRGVGDVYGEVQLFGRHPLSDLRCSRAVERIRGARGKSISGLL